MNWVFWPVYDFLDTLRHRGISPRLGYAFVPGMRVVPQLSNPLKPQELKLHLVAEGFQVFRTLGSRVVLADRVRDNLIMDSGVAAVCESPHAIRIVFRAHARDYPGETEQAMFQRVRELAASELESHCAEVESAAVPVEQPGKPGLLLDTRYEVTFERTGLALDELSPALKTALSAKKIA